MITVATVCNSTGRRREAADINPFKYSSNQLGWLRRVCCRISYRDRLRIRSPRTLTPFDLTTINLHLERCLEEKHITPLVRDASDAKWCAPSSTLKVSAWFCYNFQTHLLINIIKLRAVAHWEFGLRWLRIFALTPDICSSLLKTDSVSNAFNVQWHSPCRTFHFYY